MPANKTRLTLVRQWGMLRLLPTWPQMTTYSELAKRLADQEDFSVDPNTVRRDLEQLALIFPIYVEEQGRTHYVCWAKGADPALRSMSVGEAMALVMAEQHLGQLLPTSVFDSLQSVFKRAQQTLSAVEGHNPASTWLQKVRAVSPSQPMRPPEIQPDIQETISRALLEERQIEAHYKSSGQSDPKTIRLHPLGLIFRAPTLYLVASGWDYHDLSDVRLYAMHRFSIVQLLDQSIVVPKGFDLDEAMENGLADFGGAKPPIKLTMRVTPDLASILQETPLAQRGTPPISNQTMSPLPDGTVLITAQVNDTWQLRWWLRAQGNQIVEIISPSNL